MYVLRIVDLVKFYITNLIHLRGVVTFLCLDVK